MTLHVKDREDFINKIRAAEKDLVIIMFIAIWCGPCKLIMPQVELLAKCGKDLTILKVDVDECEELSMEYNVLLMPTFFFVRNLRILMKFSGANMEKLKDAIRKNGDHMFDADEALDGD